MSRRAILTLLAGLALALGAGVVATAKQSPEHSPALAEQLASARLATAKYVGDLGRAKADGYQIITRMIPDMGWHFMNPRVQDLDVRRPPILVYERKGRRVAARGPGVGVPPQAGHAAAAGRALRRVPRRLSLRRRDLRAHAVRGPLPAHESHDGRRLRVLAPGPRDHARVAVVPEPRRAVRELQPARQAVQPRLTTTAAAPAYAGAAPAAGRGVAAAS
jgi:hypothetical protein